MIAVSSFRPHAQSEEYARNQVVARTHWKNIFSEVHYFGDPEPELEELNQRTVFTLTKGFPTIMLMSAYAANLNADYVAMINADIVTLPGILAVEQRMKDLGLPAATSYRYEYDPENPKFTATTRDKNDRGMDIFIAMPQIWKLVSQKVPSYLRIGHPTWDTWVCGFFCDTLGYGFRQFTDERVVFHPRHGGRETPHSGEIKNDEKYFTLAKRPSPL